MYSGSKSGFPQYISFFIFTFFLQHTTILATNFAEAFVLKILYTIHAVNILILYANNFYFGKNKNIIDAIAFGLIL